MTNAEKESIMNQMDYYYDKLTLYDDNTNKRKYSYNCMLTLYNTYDFLKELWEHIADNFKIATRFVKKVIKKVVTRSSKYDEVINDNGFDIRSKNGELCYLFEFYNDDDEL